MELEAQFQQALLAQCDAAAALGCRMARLQNTVAQRGAVAAVKQLLRRRQVSDGFSQLAELGRLELSVEALVVQSRFGALFTDEEVNACFETLLEEGFTNWK